MNDKASPAFLVFSDDWGEHPSSCQHIFKNIARHHPVVWVNTVGLRMPRPTLVDFKKAFLKLNKMMRKNPGKEDSWSDLKISVLQPFMLPFVGVPGVKGFNRWSVYRSVKKALRRQGIKTPILVITAPNACDFIGAFGEERSIYYCVDDFSEWPGLDKEIVQEMEDELVRKSDRFIATSQVLYDRIADHGKAVLLLSHGVDSDFFSQSSPSEHSLLSHIPKPRVGYFGLFDDRSNQELLSRIARTLPEVSFVITGNVESDIAKLRDIDNVYFTGSIPYSELPSMANGFDICMLPYKINRLTAAIQPLKIKEYLATGKPVISTPLKEAVRLGDFVDIAENAEEWALRIKARLGGIAEEEKSKRVLFLKNESWQEKSIQFLNYCIKN